MHDRVVLKGPRGLQRKALHGQVEQRQAFLAGRQGDADGQGDGQTRRVGRLEMAGTQNGSRHVGL